MPMPIVYLGVCSQGADVNVLVDFATRACLYMRRITSNLHHSTKAPSCKAANPDMPIYHPTMAELVAVIRDCKVRKMSRQRIMPRVAVALALQELWLPAVSALPPEQLPQLLLLHAHAQQPHGPPQLLPLPAWEARE